MDSSSVDTRDVRDKVIKSFEEYLDNQDDLCVDNVNVLEVLPELLSLQNDKGVIYGRSWCKHGDLSAYFNLERKWDRIYNIMDKAMKNGIDTLFSDDSSTPTETFVDTIADLALYSLMWVGYIKETHPEEFEKFLRANDLVK